MCAGGQLKTNPHPSSAFQKEKLLPPHVKQNNSKSQYLFVILVKLAAFPSDVLVPTVNRLCCKIPLIPQTPKLSISPFVLL